MVQVMYIFCYFEPRILCEDSNGTAIQSDEIDNYCIRHTCTLIFCRVLVFIISPLLTGTSDFACINSSEL